MTTEQLLERLVAFDTTSRLSNLKLLDFVEELFAREGVPSIRLYNDDRTKANLFATIGPQVAGGIVLSGHTDVVPVDGQPWTSDPFRLTTRGGLLFGRGSADMKAFIAACLAAVPEMVRAPLKRPIHLAFSYDEEVGCIGVGSMISHIGGLGIRPALVIVGEPTSMRVVSAHKSIRSTRTHVTGLEAHSSRTHEGANAIMIAAELISHLGALSQDLRAAGDPSGRFDPPYSSLSVGLIEGGTAVNIIPRTASFAWEFRSIPGTDEEAIFQSFERKCDDIIRERIKRGEPPATIENVPRSRAPGLNMLPGAPEEALVLNLARQNRPYAVSYATEGGLFQAAGLPTYVCGPGDIAQAHKPDEFIERAQLDLCDMFLRRIIDHQSA